MSNWRNRNRSLLDVLSDHFIGRLKRAQENRAISAALAEGLLFGEEFFDGERTGVVFRSRFVTDRQYKLQNKKLLQIAGGLLRSDTIAGFTIENGEISLKQARSTSMSVGGGPRIWQELHRGSRSFRDMGYGDTRFHEPSVLADLRRCAPPPLAADVAVALLLAKALAECGLTPNAMLSVLRSGRPIIAVTSPVIGLRDRFLRLLEAGFILPGPTLLCDGWDRFGLNSAKAALRERYRRWVIVFSDRPTSPAFEERIFDALMEGVPILSITESDTPSRLSMAANLTLSTGHVTSETLRTTIRIVCGGEADPADLETVDCTRVFLDDIALAINPTNTPAVAVRLLRDFADSPFPSKPIRRAYEASHDEL